MANSETPGSLASPPGTAGTSPFGALTGRRTTRPTRPERELREADPTPNCESAGRFYAGIGSRESPPVVLQTFRELAAELEAQGWTLRSGAAAGADSAFESGITHLSHAEIYVPWSGFRGRAHGIRPAGESWAKAREIAAGIHPVFDRLKPFAQHLHTRNVFQIAGLDLDNHAAYSSFVLCWTADGAQSTEETSRGTGGTRTAIVLANNVGIPVINFARDGAKQRLDELLAHRQSIDSETRPRDRAGSPA